MPTGNGDRTQHTDEEPETPRSERGDRPISGVFEINERLRLLGEGQLSQGREVRAVRESQGRLTNEVLAQRATLARIEEKVDKALTLTTAAHGRLDNNDREHGVIARDLGANAAHDSQADIALAEEKAHRSALTRRVSELAGQVTLRRTVIVGAIAVGAAVGRVLVDWMVRHGY